MRGSPLIHCLFGAIAFALFAIPLARLAGSRADAKSPDRPNATVSKTTGTKNTFLRIRFAHQPKSLSLKQGDQELIPASSTAHPSPVETVVSLPVLPGGVELAIAASWPEGTPDTAITVELEPDELDTRHETRWSADANLTAILSFKW